VNFRSRWIQPIYILAGIAYIFRSFVTVIIAILIPACLQAGKKILLNLHEKKPQSNVFTHRVMEESKKTELVKVLIAYGLIALLFIIASHLEFLFNQ
jgi:hypothetical protein